MRLEGLSKSIQFLFLDVEPGTFRFLANHRRLSAKLMLSFAWSAQRIPSAVILGFLYRSRYFPFKYLVIYPHEAEWIPFRLTTSQNFCLTTKNTPWPLVRKRTLPTERRPLADEI
jgi:hypothetical protein